MEKEEAINLILMELAKAETKHPAWPQDKVHQAAILAEECGEAVQAALNCHYHGGDIENLRTELAHTGAMVIRCLMHIDDKKEDKVVYPGSCAAIMKDGFW